jgi:flagellar biosynthesis protein
MAVREDIRKAVAMAYDPDRHRAPQIVAKGLGQFAEVIIKIAREAGVHIREDRELVGFLMALDIGDEIPEEMYTAVAEILAFVYQLDKDKRKKAKGKKAGRKS